MGIWTEERRKDKKAKKEAKIADSERQNVMKTLMSTTHGREFIYNILEQCGWFYYEFYPNALAMAYDGGKRFVAARFIKDINDKCPEYYVLMMREANERSTRDDNRRSADDSTGSEHSGGEDGDGGDQVSPNEPDPHGYYKGGRVQER